MIVVWIPAARCLGTGVDEWVGCESDMVLRDIADIRWDPDYSELLYNMPVMFGWVVSEIEWITLHLLQSEVLLLLFSYQFCEKLEGHNRRDMFPPASAQ